MVGFSKSVSLPAATKPLNQATVCSRYLSGMRWNRLPTTNRPSSAIVSALKKVPVRGIGDIGVPKLPAIGIDRCLVEDRPDRPRGVVRSARAFVHGQRRVRARPPVISRADMCHAGVPPIERGEGLVGPGRARGVFGLRTALVADRP